MKHVPAEAIDWSPAPGEFFTGRAWFGPLSHVKPHLNALGVMFEPSARTGWHSHPEGQVLYIVNGSGAVANKDGDRSEVTTGDVVYTPPGEVHWHGASPLSFMMHLSLTTGGDTRWTGEQVTDEEYRSGASVTQRPDAPYVYGSDDLAQEADGG